MTAEAKGKTAENAPGEEKAADDEELKNRKRRERLEQNRVSARESRKRKKTMIEELQRTVITLSRENKELNDRNETLRRQLMEIGAKVRQFFLHFILVEISLHSRPSTCSLLCVSTRALFLSKPSCREQQLEQQLLLRSIQTQQQSQELQRCRQRGLHPKLLELPLFPFLLPPWLPFLKWRTGNKDRHNQQHHNNNRPQHLLLNQQLLLQDSQPSNALRVPIRFDIVPVIALHFL